MAISCCCIVCHHPCNFFHTCSPEQYQAAALPSSSFNTVLQQQQQQLPKAPSLRYQQQQQQQVSYNTVQQLNPVAEVAKVGQGRGPHWLIHVMSIGVVNILGLWGVLKLLAWSRDSKSFLSNLMFVSWILDL